MLTSQYVYMASYGNYWVNYIFCANYVEGKDYCTY